MGNNGIANEILVERLREVKPRNTLILVLGEGGQILDRIDHHQISELLGFNKAEKSFLNFFHSSPFLSGIRTETGTGFARYGSGAAARFRHPHRSSPET